MIVPILIFLLAYLLGSIPTSVWLGRIVKGIDLRDHGSGNAGTSNAFRILGWKIGVVVLVIDMLKGFLAVSLSFFQSTWTEGSEGWMILRILLGAIAVTGHIFPVFAEFRGGKGVATLAGVGLALHPLATLAALGVYLVIFSVFKLSSLGSLSAAISYPIWIIFVFKTEYISLKIFPILVTIVILITHLSNIRRIFRGEEKALNRKRANRKFIF